MAKQKRFALALLFTLLVNDICKYIRFLSSENHGKIIFFDFVTTKFAHGFVINTSVIGLLLLCLYFFFKHFFKEN